MAPNDGNARTTRACWIPLSPMVARLAAGRRADRARLSDLRAGPPRGEHDRPRDVGMRGNDLRYRGRSRRVVPGEAEALERFSQVAWDVNRHVWIWKETRRTHRARWRERQ